MLEHPPHVDTEPFEEASDDGIDILVVEDNEAERQSIVAALRAAIADVRVTSVGNGDDALDFLFARGQWASREGEEPPKLILLDLEMPGTSGISVLGQIRAIEPKEALTVAPVVIFSDSGSRSDIRESYRCGANSYIIKPLSFLDFQTVVEAVGQYWMNRNTTSN